MCFPMYFEFIKSCIVLLLIIFSVQGVYALATNNKFADCTNDDIKGCSLSFSIKISLINKSLQDPYVNAEAWLDLVVVVLMIAAFHFHRKAMRKIALEVDQDTISPPDYTLMVRHVSSEVDDVALKGFFEKVIPKTKTPIVAVNRAYDIAERIIGWRKIKDLTEAKQMANAKGKPGSELERIQKQINELEKKLNEADERDEKVSLKRAPVAFVSFETEQDAKDVIKHLKESSFKRIMRSIPCCPKISSRNLLEGHFMHVCRAPEPSDIMWENLAYSHKEKFRRRLKTFFLTAVLVVVCFGTLVGIAVGQYYINKAHINQNVIRGLGFIGSLVISVINFALQNIIREMAKYEKQSTMTGYHLSVGEKLAISTFINTAFTTFLAKIIVLNEGIHNIDIYFGEGAVVADMFFVFITNAFLSPILTVFDPMWLKKLYTRRVEEKKNDKSLLTQYQANLLFEGVNVDMATKYAALMKTMLLTSFYAPVAPIATVFAIAGLTLVYLSDKYLFLRRMVKPKQMGKELADNMTELLEWSAFLFALGSLAWFNIIGGGKFRTDQQIIASSIALVLTFINLSSPQEKLNKFFFGEKDEGIEDKTYEDALFNFDTTYGLENPVTKDEEREFILQAKERKRMKGKPNVKINDHSSQEPIESAKIFKNPGLTLHSEGEGSGLLRDAELKSFRGLPGENLMGTLKSPKTQAADDQPLIIPRISKEASKSKKKAISENLRGYAGSRLDICKVGTDAERMHDIRKNMEKEQESRQPGVAMIKNMASTAFIIALTKQKETEGDRNNDSANIVNEQANEAFVNNDEIGLVMGMFRSHSASVSKPVLHKNIDHVGLKSNKHVWLDTSDGNDADVYQKQVECCIRNLQESVNLLFPLQRIITQQSPLNKKNSNLTGLIIELDLSELTALNDQFDSFLNAILALKAEDTQSRLSEEKIHDPSIPSFEQVLLTLDLQSLDKAVSFSPVLISKIRDIRKKLFDFDNQGQAYIKKLQLNKINEHLEEKLRIKQDLLANNASLYHFSEESLDKLAAMIGLLNISKKFNRDLGTLLAIQGLNPHTYEDERKKEGRRVKEETEALKFENAKKETIRYAKPSRLVLDFKLF